MGQAETALLGLVGGAVAAMGFLFGMPKFFPETTGEVIGEYLADSEKFVGALTRRLGNNEEFVRGVSAGQPSLVLKQVQVEIPKGVYGTGRTFDFKVSLPSVANHEPQTCWLQSEDFPVHDDVSKGAVIRIIQILSSANPPRADLRGQGFAITDGNHHMKLFCIYEYVE